MSSIPCVVMHGGMMPDVQRLWTQLVKAALGHGVRVEDLGRSWFEVVRGPGVQGLVQV